MQCRIVTSETKEINELSFKLCISSLPTTTFQMKLHKNISQRKHRDLTGVRRQR